MPPLAPQHQAEGSHHHGDQEQEVGAVHASQPRKGGHSLDDLGPALLLRGALQGAGQELVPAGGAHHHHLDVECQEKPIQDHLIVSGIGFVYRFRLFIVLFLGKVNNNILAMFGILGSHLAYNSTTVAGEVEQC